MISIRAAEIISKAQSSSSLRVKFVRKLPSQLILVHLSELGSGLSPLKRTVCQHVPSYEFIQAGKN